MWYSAKTICFWRQISVPRPISYVILSKPSNVSEHHVSPHSLSVKPLTTQSSYEDQMIKNVNSAKKQFIESLS